MVRLSTLLFAFAVPIGLASGPAVASPLYYATGVYADPGSMPSANGSSLRYRPSNAVGDGADGNFWSGGIGGLTVLEFDLPGTFNGTVSVVEKTTSCVTPGGNCGGYDESANIYAFDLPAGFVADGTINGETTYDLSALMSDLLAGNIGVLLGQVVNGDAQSAYELALSGAYRYIAVLDTSDGHPSTDGFDIVSVRVTQIAPLVTQVPEPATLLLAGGGLMAVGLMRRRRKKKS